MATKQCIFCDTNFLLDVADPERQAHVHGVALLWYVAEHSASAELVASIASFKDAYYILSRLYKSETIARQSIAGLMGAFVKPVDMLARFGADALASDEPDFEDGLIRACAEHAGATAIITRDGSAFAGSQIPAMTAEQFLARERFDYELIEW